MDGLTANYIKLSITIYDISKNSWTQKSILKYLGPEENLELWKGLQNHFIYFVSLNLNLKLDWIFL